MTCCKMGTHKCSISLEAPHWSSKEYISVDKCLKDEILYLWGRGIITGGCCCGHSILPPTIAVEEEFIPKMLELGYKKYNKDFIFIAKTKLGDDSMAEKKGVPKRDGSGKGTRANMGRGGCKNPK